MGVSGWIATVSCMILVLGCSETQFSNDDAKQQESKARAQKKAQESVDTDAKGQPPAKSRSSGDPDDSIDVEAGQGSSPTDLTNSASDPGIATDEEETTVARQRQSCGSAAEVETTEKLVFPATSGRSCPFGSGYNLQRSNGSSVDVRALVIQDASFSIPDGAVLCSVSLEAAEPALRYDDYILFTFDKLLVAAAQFPRQEFLSAGMAEKDGFITFDPAKAVGHLPTSPAVNTRSTPQYCVQDGSCSMPLSDAQGAMAVALPETWFAKLPAEVVTAKTHTLSTIVTGQGLESPAGSDCGHSGITFVATVHYVP